MFKYLLFDCLFKTSVYFTSSQNHCIFRNPCKGSMIMWSIHVQSMVFISVISRIPHIPISRMHFEEISIKQFYTVGSASTWPSRRVYFTRLLSTSGCSSAHDIQVWSHTHHILPIEAKEILKYGLRKLRNINFDFVKKLC